VTADHAAGVDANRELWNAWADLHVDSSFYDVDSFVADPAARPLDGIVLENVGDVAGKRLLHLQCHFGMDTLRFAMMGAEVTGVDFSPTAIAHARRLAERLGVPGTFVETDVRSLPDEVEPGGFDVVFTSYGVITWLPELTAWAETIASRLAPGGVFCIVESHPTLWIFDEALPEPPLSVRYSYFSDGNPLVLPEKGSYAVPDAEFEGESHSWQHTFEDILGALLGAGLRIESLREYPRISWQHFPFLEQDAEGLWRLPACLPEIPLMFALRAVKPL
jgi:SAM-dependent methyltransferase